MICSIIFVCSGMLSLICSVIFVLFFNNNILDIIYLEISFDRFIYYYYWLRLLRATFKLIYQQVYPSYVFSAVPPKILYFCRHGCFSRSFLILSCILKIYLSLIYPFSTTASLCIPIKVACIDLIYNLFCRVSVLWSHLSWFIP